MRKDKKENERLQKEVNDLNMHIGNILRQQYNDRDTINDLREELSAEKGKYAALLEKHIAMMEKATKRYNPGDEVLTIFCEIESMLLAWYAANYYDAGLATGFERIKKKHTEV